MTDWLIENYIEVLGAILSIIYLFLSVRQNIWLWPLGMLSAGLYIVVFFQTKFYADMGLNFYYLIISIYGWANWSLASKRTGHQLPVSSIGGRRFGWAVALLLFLFLVLGTLLDRFTDSPLPYWDAFTTAGSVIATWMLTKKYIEHWILWVIVDVVSMGLYIYRGLYPTALLFIVYSTMAVIGYIQWSRAKQTMA